MWRHRCAGLAAILLLDDAAEVVDGDAVQAHLDQCTHHSPHHVAEEAVGCDGEHPLLPHPVPLGTGDDAVVGLDIGVEFAERGYSNR